MIKALDVCLLTFQSLAILGMILIQLIHMIGYTSDDEQIYSTPAVLPCTFPSLF
jgi:hypothetical protein